MAELAADVPSVTQKKGMAWPKWGERFFDVFAESGIVEEAAKAAGVSRTTVYRHRAGDPAFAARWAEVEEWSTEQLEQIAYKRASDGSDLLLIFLLKARKPGMYREHVKVEHGGGYRVTHEKEENIDDEIARFLAANDEIGDRSSEAESAGADRAAGPAARS